MSEMPNLADGKPHDIHVQLGRNSSECRVFVDDVDISHNVHGCQVEVKPGELTIVRLELFYHGKPMTFGFRAIAEEVGVESTEIITFNTNAVQNVVPHYVVFEGVR